MSGPDEAFLAAPLSQGICQSDGIGEPAIKVEVLHVVFEICEAQVEMRLWCATRR